MKKALPIILVLTAIIIVGVFFMGVKVTRTVDWEESFNEKSNKPYGTSIFYKELNNLFKNRKIRTIYHQPDSYLQANSEDGYGDHTAKGNYIIIGNTDYLSEESIDELLNFVDNGNTLFLSDYVFPQKFHDTLDVSIDYLNNEKDSITYHSLKYLDIKNIKIDRSAFMQYFSYFDSINHSVLGHSKTIESFANFIKVPFGEGQVFLHTEPKVFTNYNVLKNNRYKYVEGIISYLPDDDIYFDSYTKMQTRYTANVEKESNLSWFLQQPAFKWAWYTAIIFGILFMIFNAKRRQRIIKIIKPLQNTTVGFVKTVSNLYLETQDYKNIVDKKITYFLERIRTDYHINTTVLDDAFLTKLSAKTGKKKEDIKPLINYINWLRSKNEFFEENLIKLNRQIEAFYTK
ncbi:hypothetical protein PW52_08385 [Tamlana sedimentorum]|uniref:DUF4350 domain-containing protein n=1 Tax=Neotamlana sedimentorum TaxID=1435349 RepID=A0A0D7W9F0_9FLAO|nr:DUF4350 domain-containing protein [Tamlana sedimentorum]KJD35746.1 hypothetical protein PW52_08385 [Tamlana sedimentorum]